MHRRAVKTTWVCQITWGEKSLRERGWMRRGGGGWNCKFLGQGRGRGRSKVRDPAERYFGNQEEWLCIFVLTQFTAVFLVFCTRHNLTVDTQNLWIKNDIASDPFEKHYPASSLQEMFKEGKKRKQCGRNVSGASKDEGSCGTMRFELSLVSFSQRQNIFLQYFFFSRFLFTLPWGCRNPSKLIFVLKSSQSGGEDKHSPW